MRYGRLCSRKWLDDRNEQCESCKRDEAFGCVNVGFDNNNGKILGKKTLEIDESSLESDENRCGESGCYLDVFASNTGACVQISCLTSAKDVRNATVTSEEFKAEQNKVNIAKTKEDGAYKEAELSSCNQSTHFSHNEAHRHASSEKPKSIKNELKPLFLSGIYLWALWIVSFSMLQMYFYVSSFDNLITRRSSSKKVLSHYTNAFGIIQFFRLLFVPVIGPYL